MKIRVSACVRNICYFTASYNIDLEVKPIQGELNLYAGVLSSWNLHKKQDSVTINFLKSCEWETLLLNMFYPNFSI